jgi:hypothetical protein
MSSASRYSTPTLRPRTLARSVFQLHRMNRPKPIWNFRLSEGCIPLVLDRGTYLWDEVPKSHC